METFKTILNRLMILIPVLIVLNPALGRAENRITISVATLPSAIKKFNSLPEAARNTPLSLSNIAPEINSGCSVSLMIIKNAMKLSGIDVDFKFIQVPNSRREIDEVAKGNAVIGSNLFNEKDISIHDYNAKVYLTTAIAQSGEFHKGIYCLPENRKMHDVKTLEDLKKAGTALIGLHWNNDYRVLSGMGITRIERGQNMDNMFRMIKAGRADWIPLGFQNHPGMTIKHAGISLVPVKGIKISLIESRHFIISRRHPQGEQIYQALEKGMEAMRNDGIMQKLMHQGGYTCPEVETWKDLNPIHLTSSN
ncbi:hypothetical protein [Maridesulfovibrio sp. FT414]|uniref:hypothetical protein n=1 Tax=Maridesulfovibrio sp. FT414 TaxID=2979469 RepID=UPI003D807100